MEKKTAADILEIAAQSYEAEIVNWCQDAWVDPDLKEAYASAEWWGEGFAKRSWADMPDEGAVRINACAMGAMVLADGWTWQQNMEHCTERIINEWGSDGLRSAVKALETHLQLERLGNYFVISSWNDDMNRTKDEVIEAMKATAKDLRNQEEAA